MISKRNPDSSIGTTKIRKINMNTENTELNKTETKTAPESHVHVHGPNCNHGHHHHELLRPITRSEPKIGRNDPCTCGSQKKYKKCCGI
ncbi:MAG: SEC-C domain-containing protein [Bdellovibrionales bacterium]|nr:SEC-C domain-containing protein [Bdellovibrionales bacterium]